MSTEKSLLTINDTVLPKIDHSLETDGLHFPVGVLPSGNTEIVRLVHNEGTTHICIIGKVGSGCVKYIEFTLKALYRMYGENILLNYLDGTGNEYKYWKKKQMPTNYLCDCSTVDKLTTALENVLLHVTRKDTKTPEVLVIADISHLLVKSPERITHLLQLIYIESSKKNVNILYMSQRPIGDLSELSNKFGLVCTTCVREEDSIRIFGSNVASKEAGVRKYGDLTYCYKGNVSRVRVPFCDARM